MREIIFRGKREDNGEWVYGDLRQYKDMPIKCDDFYCIDTCSTVNGFGTNHTVIGRTVGQYTGLTDKNGVKIFEGDILRTSNKNEPIWYVDYKLCCFCVNQRNVNYSCRLDEFEIETDLEVIGNIHDNPELLDKIDED